MSGIFGFFCKKNKKADVGSIETLKKWNSIYGRDGYAFKEGDSYGVGCYYEKVSVHPAECNYVIEKENRIFAIDAIIYNRKDVLAALGTTGTDMSDEELLAEIICKKGPAGLKTVNGDFAGAVYDTKNDSLLLFRDHMGARTLFCSADDDMVVFSTDIRGVVSVQGIKTGVDENWLYVRMSRRISLSQTDTAFKNVVCVHPGSTNAFSFSAGKLVSKETCYWEAGKKKIRFKKEEDYRKELRRLVEDAIKIRREAYPGKGGAELSGGLDSSVISALLSRLNKDEAYYSWSISPDEVAFVENDERLAILELCKEAGIECGFSSFKESKKAEHRIDGITDEIFGETDKEIPFPFRNKMPPYFTAFCMIEALEYFEKGVKVVFSGHGGDEGISHRGDVYEMFYHHEYYHFFRTLWSYSHGKKKRISKFIAEVKSRLITNRHLLVDKAELGVNSELFLNENFIIKMEEKDYQAFTFFFDPTYYVRHGGSRPRLELMTLLSAYYGIRYVAPFLDYRVIDFALSIPRYLYIKSKTDRYIYRETFKDLLPKSIYKITVKETASKNGMESEDDWYDSYEKIIKQIVDSLDRNVWSEYLDFDKIDAWVEKGKPVTDEDLRMFDIYFYYLSVCNLINIALKDRDGAR